MRHLILFLIILTACNTSSTQENNSLRYVRTEVVHFMPDIEQYVLTGFSKSEISTDVSFRIPGLIQELPIKVGDVLKKGDLIAKLDEHDYILQQDEANAQLEKALAEARNTASRYKRIKLLYESESASRNELDSSRAQNEASQAAVERAVASFELVKKQLSYTSLVASEKECVISRLHVEKGENIAQGHPVATITCGNTLQVEVAVPEKVISRISEKQKVKVFFNAYPDLNYVGSISEIGNVASQGTTFPVTIALDKTDPNLRPGMAVKVVALIKMSDTKKKMLVLKEAVGEDKEGPFVYVFEKIQGDIGKVRKQPVTIGLISNSGIEIFSGLKESDEIITAGVRYLRDGLEVKRLK